MSHTSEGADVQSNDWAWLNWPVIGGNVTVIAFFQKLWDMMPTPTAIYTIVTIVFMLFQMADKLGMLDGIRERRKRRAGD